LSSQLDNSPYGDSQTETHGKDLENFDKESWTSSQSSLLEFRTLQELEEDEILNHMGFIASSDEGEE